MAGFVAEDLHAPRLVAPFDLEHLRALEALEPRMGEVEGNRHPGNAIGREPFCR